MTDLEKAKAKLVEMVRLLWLSGDDVNQVISIMASRYGVARAEMSRAVYGLYAELEASFIDKYGTIYELPIRTGPDVRRPKDPA